VTIAAQDLSLGGPNVTLDAAQGISSQADAESALLSIQDSIGKIFDAVSELGSGSLQLERTKVFTETLQAKTREGIGNLVDADIAKASAEFTADKVRQALSVQSLSISNQQPAVLLTLFANT